jgi:SAM-dependent methyltransferase
VTQATPTTEDPVGSADATGVEVPRRARWQLLVLAVIAYVPLLYSRPGWIASDTKAYLYLDPAQLTRMARYMWDPLVGMGTVTHQNIGYLFPMGPWYWALHEVGVPTWIAQRLWMGTLLFAAGAGVRYLARLLGVTAWGQLAAALIYMLTPYIVDYITRTSAILMPWAGLGWLIGFLIVAVRRGGWRYPALFALVVALIGGVNATSVLLVGLAPLVWVLLAGITKEARWRDVVMATVRAGVLSVVVSLWWVAGLWAEGAYGVNVLRYTETFPTVTMTSLSSEVLRGLGYWYFYGNDAIQPWTLPSSGYMLHDTGILLSFLVPALALLGAAVVRWRYRFFSVCLVVVGVVLAVGAYPLSDPSPLGRVFRSLGENSTIGLAMRSSNRVLPLVVLGMALLAGSAVGALAQWRPNRAAIAGCVVGVLACANLAPLFEGNLVATNLMFPETLPTYVTEAAHFLNASGSTPVLGLPGEDFGYYRWGVTMDSVWPGLLTRPYIQRQAVLQGEPASANLLRALDESIQDGVMVPSSIAPMARLLGAGTILLQSNLQYERFDLPRPQALWLQLRPTPQGLAIEREFGAARLVPTEVGTILDETQLMIPDSASYPPDLTVYRVADPRALLRTESMQAPILLAGDGSGILLAAGAGLLDGPPRAIVYAASRPNATLQRLAAEPDAELVLTDTNAKELDTWGTLHTTYGYVQQVGARQLSYEPGEQALPIFSTLSPSTQTVLVLRGIASVNASGYGNPVANAPEDQPLAAIDGNPRTAWEVGAFSDPRGQFLQVEFDHPVDVSRLTLQQPQIGVRTRWLTKVRLGFSSGPSVRLDLGAASRVGGETFHFAPHLTRSLTITVTGMSGSQTNFSGLNGVGFAEVRIPGVGLVRSALRLPTDLLGAAGSGAKYDRIIILVHRLRASTVPPRTDPELSMARAFILPSTRSFAVSGSMSVSSLISDKSLDALLGRGGGTGLHVVSTQDSTRLVGSLVNSSWAAFDNNPLTSWLPAFDAKGAQGVTATLSGRLALRDFKVRVLVDGRHSVPTSIEVATNTGEAERAPLVYPPRPRRAVPQGTYEDVEVRFARTLTGTKFAFSFPTQRTILTIDHIADNKIALPIGIADIVLPGVAPATTPAAISKACRSGLLTIDGRDVPIRIYGSTAGALLQDELHFKACQRRIALPAGASMLVTSPGYATGWNLDDVDLVSPAITRPGPHRSKAILATADVTHVKWLNPVSLQAQVGPQRTSSWLVLNQSFSKGWSASVDGKSLGIPDLIDGGFTAWRLPPMASGGSVSITWTPQHVVDDALLVSLVGLALLAVLIALRARRRTLAYRAELDEDHTPQLAWPWRSTAKPSLVLAGIATVIAMAISGPTVAIVIVPLVALAWFWPRLRVALAVAPAALLAACGLYVAYEQHEHFYVHSIEWTTNFPLANTLGWVAVSLLLVDVAAFGGILRLRPSVAVATHTPGSSAPARGDPAGVVPGTLGTPKISYDVPPQRVPLWQRFVPARRRKFRPPKPPKPKMPGPGRMARFVPPRLHGLLAVLAPKRFGAEEPPDVAGTIISLPGSGLARSVSLLRAFRQEQSDPDLFYRTLALDTLHRLMGTTPLFNRSVLDVGGGPGYFGEAFRTAGARVVLVEPEAAAPLPERLDIPDALLDERDRHERTVWPGRLLVGDTIAGDGMALPLPDDAFDVVFSSNVLEHVVDPARFLDESVRVAKPGGLVYCSFTVWWGPWGGHETSPWHLVSGSYAKRRYTKHNGHPPKNVYGESLFSVHVGEVLKLVRHRKDVEIVAIEPRYYPSWARFIVRLPLLREVLTWNLVVLLEKL